jgi:N-acyl-D-amino-acid deacylase
MATRPDQARLVALAAALAAAVAVLAAAPPPAPERPQLLRGATVLDGTGSPGRVAAVRIEHGRIAAIGELALRPGDALVDARGLTLAPGFIDAHSHHGRGLASHPEALAVVSQGVTTIVVGQDGESEQPLGRFFGALEAHPVAVNVASDVGHNTARHEVMGEDFRRPATPAEVERMKAIVEAGMRDGALGLSSGLEYDPGIYSTPEEVIELARVAARHGGRYISHLRSEDRAFWKAVDELVEIGRQAHLPVQHTHAKLAQRSLWGEADRLLARLSKARDEGVRVTMDVYPYTYWHSTVTVLFPERNFDDRAAAEYALREVAGPEALLLSAFAPVPSYVGHTLAEIASGRGSDAPTTLRALIREALDYERAHPEAEDVEGVIGTSMAERDVETLLRWREAGVCTDGALEGRHPRGYGAFARVLGEYVRERRVLTLEEAVRKMTSQTARAAGIAGRGTIAVGQAADLVLFDPATVADRATTKDPLRTSEGIRAVWVNGALVYRDGQPTGARPGRPLRRRP